ncbi:MAG TPA: pseudouridine synthase [Candidatus Binataceae bacterium]|nr:pseudouridine synthase [Candidatus Binataceae bacterium]
MSTQPQSQPGKSLDKALSQEGEQHPRKERIAKFMARAGVASRRESERLIAAGRVTLNGSAVTHPATLAGADDLLMVDGKIIAAPERSRLWRYHKPAGLVTTAYDPEGRPTVFANLPRDLPRLISVGRLDINTEGLLLLTNDGGLARFFEHPAQGLSRTYRVRAHGNPGAIAVAKLASGLTIGGIRYRPIQATFERRQGGNCWITMTLSEGKNREIKIILEHLGLQVTRLIRIGYGSFELSDLPPSTVAEVSPSRLPKLIPNYFF